MANIQSFNHDDLFGIFILNFGSEEFFRVDGSVEWVQGYSTPFNYELPKASVTINGEAYHPGVPFVGTHIMKGDKVAIIFTYGEPTDGQLQAKLTQLLEDGA